MGVSGDTISVPGELIRVQEELRDTIKGCCLHSGTMVTQEG